MSEHNPIMIPSPIPLDMVGVDEEQKQIEAVHDQDQQYLQRAREVAIRIGNRELLNVHELACKIRVPAFQILEIVRAGHIRGKKVGKAYLIAAEDFYAYICSGNLEKGTRARSEGVIKTNVRRDQAHIDGQDESFTAYLKRLESE